MSGFLYIDKLKSGVKIGWTKDPRANFKSYARHGDKINRVLLIHCSYSFDDIIKRSLILLGKQIKLPDQNTTEAYDITTDQAIRIFKHIQEYQTITCEIIRDLLSDRFVHQSTQITQADLISCQPAQPDSLASESMQPDSLASESMQLAQHEQSMQCDTCSLKQFISFNPRIEPSLLIESHAVVRVEWVEHELTTIREFRINYGVKYKAFRFQRPTDPKRIPEIVKYINLNYKNPEFHMPSIILAKINNQYEIIDGMHRSEAFCALEDSHPILQRQIILTKYSDLTYPQAQKLFFAINSNKQVPKLYLDINYIADLQKYISESIGKKYSKKIIKPDVKHGFQPYITNDKLNEFCSAESITALLEKGIINVADNQEILNILIRFNEELYNTCIGLLGHDIFDGNQSVEKNTTADWSALLVVLSDLNRGSNYKLETLQKTLQKIKDELNERRQLIIEKKFKNKSLAPFLLGLIVRRSIVNAIELLPTLVRTEDESQDSNE